MLFILACTHAYHAVKTKTFDNHDKQLVNIDYFFYYVC